jgi:hypothetical protein
MRRSITTLMGLALTGSSVLAAAGASGAPTLMRAATARPAAEHVPSTIGYVRISYTAAGRPDATRRIVLHHRKAHHLAKLFNHLEPEPPGTAHCDVATAWHTTVTFRGPHHTWTAVEVLCRNIEVNRDGRQLPTLLPSKKWEAALTHYLGHSPTAPPPPPVR